MILLYAPSVYIHAKCDHNKKCILSVKQMKKCRQTYYPIARLLKPYQENVLMNTSQTCTLVEDSDAE